jgi:hypothetical protein
MSGQCRETNRRNMTRKKQEKEEGDKTMRNWSWNRNRERKKEAINTRK